MGRVAPESRPESDVAGRSARRMLEAKGGWPTRPREWALEACAEGYRVQLRPVLADALEEAGCGDADLLGHLRSPGPHVRGCLAVDLLLGLS
jgi:hypothetical protein